MTPKVLAVIPARGGSKDIPLKNLMPLGGKPLIAYTIEVARAVPGLTRVVVSTDDLSIAEEARRLGAEVPFLRPAELAGDASEIIPVLQHTVPGCERHFDERYEVVILLQPTCPFRTAADVAGALDLLLASGADSVISVVAVEGHHPARMKYLEGERLIDPPFCEVRENQPRQELTPMYIRNGAIYACRRDVLMREGSLKGKDCRAWIMPPERSVNIDTPWDLEIARYLIERRRHENPAP